MGQVSLPHPLTPGSNSVTLKDCVSPVPSFQVKPSFHIPQGSLFWLSVQSMLGGGGEEGVRLVFSTRLNGQWVSLVVQMEEEGSVIATCPVFVFFLDVSPKGGNEMRV